MGVSGYNHRNVTLDKGLGTQHAGVGEKAHNERDPPLVSSYSISKPKINRLSTKAVHVVIFYGNK